MFYIYTQTRIQGCLPIENFTHLCFFFVVLDVESDIEMVVESDIEMVVIKTIKNDIAKIQKSPP